MRIFKFHAGRGDRCGTECPAVEGAGEHARRLRVVKFVSRGAYCTVARGFALLAVVGDLGQAGAHRALPCPRLRFGADPPSDVSPRELPVTAAKSCCREILRDDAEDPGLGRRTAHDGVPSRPSTGATSSFRPSRSAVRRGASYTCHSGAFQFPSSRLLRQLRPTPMRSFRA